MVALVVVACLLVPQIHAESPWLDDQNLGTPLRTAEAAKLPPELLDAASRLAGRALLSNRAMETLEELCDDVGARLSGSAEANHAVEWCVARLKKDGFENAHAEKATVPHWVRGRCEAAMTSPRLQPMHACALGGSVGTGGKPLVASVVATESLESLAKLSREQVDGRIVLFTRRMTRDGGEASGYGATVSIRGRGASAAAKLGAVGVMIRSVGTANARLPHTGNMSYEEGITRIPAIALSAEDAEMIDRLLARGIEVKASFETTCAMEGEVESANVVADLPGREKPDEIVLLSGHLDSWDLASGAIDDGAGCVIAWEAARLMRELGIKPRRTIRIVLWMSEENGSSGAKAYATQHEAEAGKHVVAIEADSGAGRPLAFGLTCAEPDLARVQALAPLVRGLGCGTVKKGGGGADVGQLRRLAIPTMGLNQDDYWYFDYHHTPADTPDKVDPHELSLNVAAMAVMAYAIADLEPRLAPAPPAANDRTR